MEITKGGLPFFTIVFLLTNLCCSSAIAEPWLPKSMQSQVRDRADIPDFPIINPQTDHYNPASRWSKNSVSDEWNKEAIRLIVKYNVNPLKASRALTLLDVSMHDAWWHASELKLSEAGRISAIHAAAAIMLDQLFPLEPNGRVEALGMFAISTVAELNHQEIKAVSFGKEIGETVAHDVILYALNDGADKIWDARTRPVPGPRIWQPTPPLDTAHPQEPLAGTWRTWILRDGGEIQPPAALDEEQLAQAAFEVLEVNKKLTKEQKKIAEYWHLDQGSVTPPGIWNIMALDLANRHKFDEEKKLNMLSALNIGMYDASIACWHTKFTWWTPRPITIIRKLYDKNFLPYLVTPPHPSYVSGHATISGASAEILKYFFPEEASRIDGWAEEAAMSRLYGGIHYRFDNESGLWLGREIGKKVIKHLATENATTIN